MKDKDAERTVVISTKVTPADAEAIREAAEKMHMTISQYVRGATFVSMALDGNKYALKTIGRAWFAVMREMVGRLRGEAGEAFEEKIKLA